MARGSLIEVTFDEAMEAIRWTTNGDKISLHEWLYENLFAAIASPMNASLLYALAYTGLMFLLAYALYRKNWFLRV